MPAAKKAEKKQPVSRVLAKKMVLKSFSTTLQAIPGTILVNNNLRAKANIDMMRRRLLGYSTSTKGRRRDPYLEYQGARYLNDDGVDCVPTNGIKKSICSALQFYSDIDLTQARANRIIGVNVSMGLTPIRFVATPNKDAVVFENTWAQELADLEEEIEEDKKKGKKTKKKVKEPEILYQCTIDDDLPDFREDVVRLQGQTKAPDLRYRPAFKDWELDIIVQFPPAIISQTALINLISLAGETIGLCEWRPEKGGDWGMYRIKP